MTSSSSLSMLGRLVQMVHWDMEQNKRLSFCVVGKSEWTEKKHYIHTEGF